MTSLPTSQDPHEIPHNVPFLIRYSVSDTVVRPPVSHCFASCTNLSEWIRVHNDSFTIINDQHFHDLHYVFLL